MEGVRRKIADLRKQIEDKDDKITELSCSLDEEQKCRQTVSWHCNRNILAILELVNFFNYSISSVTLTLKQNLAFVIQILPR